MMHRKIIKSGQTSFVLSLPINWIRKNKLSSGSTINVSENDFGDLILLVDKKIQQSEQEIITIKVDNKERKEINLELLIAYVRDPNLIIFEGKEIVSKASTIIGKIQKYIGLDIIEQDINSITVKNFFSLDEEVSPYVLLKKMDFINRTNLTLLKRFFNKNFANEDFFELQKLHEQNNNLFILTKKCILKLLEYPLLMKKIKTNNLQIVKDRIFAQSLIRISFNLRILGNAFLLLGVKRAEIKDFEIYFNTFYNQYLSLLKAFYNKDNDAVYNFLKHSSEETSELEQFMKRMEDPLLIQATTTFLSNYHHLRDMAYEYLF
jgi:phosphate uptake regulator